MSKYSKLFAWRKNQATVAFHTELSHNSLILSTVVSIYGNSKLYHIATVLMLIPSLTFMWSTGWDWKDPWGHPINIPPKLQCKWRIITCSRDKSRGRQWKSCPHSFWRDFQKLTLPCGQQLCFYWIFHHRVFASSTMIFPPRLQHFPWLCHYLLLHPHLPPPEMPVSQSHHNSSGLLLLSSKAQHWHIIIVVISAASSCHTVMPFASPLSLVHLPELYWPSPSQFWFIYLGLQALNSFACPSTERSSK